MKNWNNSDELANEYREDLKALTGAYERLKEQRTKYMQLKKNVKNVENGTNPSNYI